MTTINVTEEMKDVFRNAATITSGLAAVLGVYERDRNAGLRDARPTPLTEAPEPFKIRRQDAKEHIRLILKLADSEGEGSAIEYLTDLLASVPPTPAPAADAKLNRLSYATRSGFVSDFVEAEVSLMIEGESRRCGTNATIVRMLKEYQSLREDETCDPSEPTATPAPAPAAGHVKTPLDWANEEIRELRSCISMLISAVEGNSVANYNAVRRNALELLRGTAHQSPAPAAEQLGKDIAELNASRTGGTKEAWEIDFFPNAGEAARIAEQAGEIDEKIAAIVAEVRSGDHPVRRQCLALADAIELIAAMRKRGSK